MGDIIPGLPNEMAMECLLRLHFESIPNAIFVCKNWKREIRSPDYLSRRSIGGHSQSIFVMMLAKRHPNLENEDHQGVSMTSRLAMFELKSGNWIWLPPIPGFSKTLPVCSQLVIAGLNLVVISECRQKNSVESNEVYIYNFLSNMWRRGADMPNGRSDFICASYSDLLVYVVGGYNMEIKDMEPTLTYDVVKDEWVQLPDMEIGLKDEGFCLSSKLHVIGTTDYNFQRVEFVCELGTLSVNPLKWKWSPAAQCLRSFVRNIRRMIVAGHDGKLLVRGEHDVAVVENGQCKKLANLHGCLCGMNCLRMLNKYLAVSGYTGPKHKESGSMSILDLESKEWFDIQGPKDYSFIVPSTCYLEI